MIDIFTFCDTEIVDIFSGTVDSKLEVNLRAPDRLRVKYYNKIIPILLRHQLSLMNLGRQKMTKLTAK